MTQSSYKTCHIRLCWFFFALKSWVFWFLMFKTIELILHRKGLFCIPFCLEYINGMRMFSLSCVFLLQTPTEWIEKINVNERMASTNRAVHSICNVSFDMAGECRRLQIQNSIDKRMPVFRLMLQWKCHFYCYVSYILTLTPKLNRNPYTHTQQKRRTQFSANIHYSSDSPLFTFQFDFQIDFFCIQQITSNTNPTNKRSE